MSKAATKQTKPAVGKGGKVAPKHKFIIDYSRPAADQIFDTAGFEKFLHDHIKVDGKAGNLGDKVKITKNDQRLTLTSQIPFSKRYLKYLTKKFLKKSTLRDFIRVVASSKDTYELRFFNLSTADEEEE
ncbi:putative ribosomal protein L22 [Serendipita vermifera]|nr:putative ribosomal protein L22 [Serendipita vermifera]